MRHRGMFINFGQRSPSGQQWSFSECLQNASSPTVLTQLMSNFVSYIFGPSLIWGVHRIWPVGVI